MAESLTQTKHDIWADPTRLAYIHRVIAGHVQDASEISRVESGHDVDVRRLSSLGAAGKNICVEDAWGGLFNRLNKVTRRISDTFLFLGIVELADERAWQAISGYVMTPETDKKPAEVFWQTDISGAAGAVCLAARFSGQYIMADFSGITIGANPDTRPQTVQDTYIEAAHERYHATTETSV